jgi:trichothecene 3-O-acetyltransferase
MLAQPLQPHDVLKEKAPKIILEPKEEPIYQDVMGQFPQLMTYNHGSAIFKLDEGVSRDTVVRDVEDAVAKIVGKIPWLGQRVVREGASQEHSGSFTVAPWPEGETNHNIVRVKDCSDLCPSYDELIAAQAPVQMLDGNVLCPVPGFPGRYDESKLGPPPACLIQINFINGGAILTFSNQHNVMDGTGIFNVIMLLARVMNGKDVPDSAVIQGNRDPSTAIPLYPAGVPIRDHDYLRARPITTPPLDPAKWAQIRFLKQAQSHVKALANEEAGYDSSVPFISTGDAVCALYWKCLAKARIARGQDPASVSRISRAIDSRAAMKIPMSFMGQLVYSSRSYLAHHELADLPLSTIACVLRKNLNNDNTEHSIRSYATYIAREPNKMKLTYAGPCNRATDISCSSMATAALVLRFGVLGEPVYIRRPNLGPINGCLYFYPPEVSGDLNLLVCLNDYEMEALKKDELWGTSTEFIG